MRNLIAGTLVLWALGVVLHEVIEQVAAGVVIALALLLWRRVPVADDVRRFARATVVMLAWFAVSPLVALLRGLVTEWPPSGRYGQLQDLAAIPALAVVATVVVPWRAIAWTVVTGWVASFAVGVYQHVYWWKWDLSWLTGQPEWRVHQSLDGKRFTAGGLLFHRLRFAHTALAITGPAVAALVRSGPLGARAGGFVLVLVTLGSAYVAYARTALGAMLLVAGAGLLWLGRDVMRKAGLAALAGVALLVFTYGPMRALVSSALGSFESDRGAAMKLAWEIVTRHWLVGVGFGNHQAFATPLAPAGSTWVVPHTAHATVLQVWTETGLVGLAMYAWVSVLLVRALWSRRAHVVSAGALLSWVGFHAASTVHSLQSGSGVMLAFAFVWGLGLATAPDGAQETIQPPPTTSSPS